MRKIIIVTPHPDDETLGCGGTILKHKENGHLVYWLIITKMGNEFNIDTRMKRKEEIEKVAKIYGFEETYQLDLDAGKLDEVPLGDMIGKIGEVFNKCNPNIIYLPFRSDIHSDHKVVFDAASACTKWFRYQYVEKVLVYETLSETDFVINPDSNKFHPNVFTDISKFIEKKLEIMSVYESEIGEHPFPRSIETIKALATIRGAASGYYSAEAFMLLKERS